jgi:hypothetical protein
MLDVQVTQGEISASAVYYYGKSASRLSYNRVQLYVSGSRAAEAANLAPAMRADTARQFSTERAAISDIGFLRAIANNRGTMTLRFMTASGETKEFDLPPSAQAGIAETLEIYDAIKALQGAGRQQIQRRY